MITLNSAQIFKLIVKQVSALSPRDVQFMTYDQLHKSYDSPIFWGSLPWYSSYNNRGLGTNAAELPMIHVRFNVHQTSFY